MCTLAHNLPLSFRLATNTLALSPSLHPSFPLLLPFPLPLPPPFPPHLPLTLCLPLPFPFPVPLPLHLPLPLCLSLPFSLVHTHYTTDTTIQEWGISCRRQTPQLLSKLFMAA